MSDSLNVRALADREGRETIGRRLCSVLTDVSREEQFDRLIEVLLISLLTFAPLALGTVHAWSKQVVIALAALATGVFLLKLVLCRSVPFVWSWTYVPLVVFVFVAVLQLVPLPSSIVEFVSPHTASLKRDLLGDLPGADESLSSMTLSFYPSATKHDLRLVLAVAAVFVLVVNTYRQPERIKRLLAAIAVIGGGVALLALLQVIAGNGKIYWFIPTYDGASSGSFVNHSHYGQFMNLSMGAALALLFVTLREAFSGGRVTPPRVADYLASSAGLKVKVLLAMIVLGAATVFVSLTRGGMLSMFIAAVFTALMLSWRQSLQGRGWILVILALGSFLCVLYVGFDQVYDRLATLRDLRDAQSGRWQIVKDIALAWTQFPVFGVGLGTHEVVYPMFDRSTIALLAMHAENEYAQAAEETGLVGLLALACFGVMVWVRYAKDIRPGAASIRVAAYGLGFGLLAILVHSLSDFGQHLPANALLTAVFCGLLIALRSTRTGPTQTPVCVGVRAPVRIGRTIALLAAIGLWTWALLGANGARVAEAHWNKVRVAEQHLEADNWMAPPVAYEYLFHHAISAVEAEPDNIHYRHWLGMYKWLSLTPYLDPNTGQLPVEALPWAAQIVAELQEARPLCPTFGALYCVVGEIERFVLGDPTGAERITRGYQLAPCDATACFAAARIDVEDNKPDKAFAKLIRAVQLDGRYFEKAAQLCVNDLNRPELALQLASDHTGRLILVKDLLAIPRETDARESLIADGDASVDDDNRQQFAEQAAVKILQELKTRCAQPDAPASAFASLASLYRQEGDLERAIQHYERAVRLDYGHVGWHYALAEVLGQQGRVDEAIHEARICLRLQPGHIPAKRLIQKLSVRPVMSEQKTVSVG